MNVDNLVSANQTKSTLFLKCFIFEAWKALIIPSSLIWDPWYRKCLFEHPNDAIWASWRPVSPLYFCYSNQITWCVVFHLVISWFYNIGQLKLDLTDSRFLMFYLIHHWSRWVACKCTNIKFFYILHIK